MPGSRRSKRGSSKRNFTTTAATTTAAAASATATAKKNSRKKSKTKNGKSTKPTLDPTKYKSIRDALRSVGCPLSDQQIGVLFNNLLTQEEIEAATYKKNHEAVRQHCIAVATIVKYLARPDGLNAKFRSMLEFFECDEKWNAVCMLWNVIEMGSLNPTKIKVLSKGLKSVKKRFRDITNTDLKDYRSDLETLYENESWSEFVKRFIIYSSRDFQDYCSNHLCKNDAAAADKRGGGSGYNDSDHGLENLYYVLGCLKKQFEVTVGANVKSIAQLLAELAKILRTCCLHHQNDSSNCSCYNDLLPKVSGSGYMLVDENGVEATNFVPIAPCVFSETDKGKHLHDFTNKYAICMECSDLEDITFQDVANEYEEHSSFRFVDNHRQTEEKFRESTVSQRRYAFRRTELATYKTEARCCFFCEMSSMNAACRDKSGFDLHHMLELMKLHNPSEGVKKTIEEQRLEILKTIMLCRGCHVKITHNPEEMKKLKDKFDRLGYVIDEKTGVISCTEKHDGLRVVAKSK